MAYRFSLGAKGATDELATSLRCSLVLAALLLSLETRADSARLIEPPRPIALPERFAAAMTRARLNWFIYGPKPLSVAVDLALPRPSIIPFFWEADDGSTIRRMPDGTFRMEIWSAATNWTSYHFCEPAGWPSYVCMDGTIHEMSAPDLSTVIFAGRTFTRTLRAADLAADEPKSPQE
jgi:hypothetical protein